MKTINNQELLDIKGGFSVWVGVTVAAIVVFLTGLLDGFVHPKDCD